ncbi:hypothetical protein LIA77_10778 [Sarocladium implicatum]|nr:hypothetical protein LIA77_10778 [Sarocladium implicatum]
MTCPDATSLLLSFYGHPCRSTTPTSAVCAAVAAAAWGQFLSAYMLLGWLGPPSYLRSRRRGDQFLRLLNTFDGGFSHCESSDSVLVLKALDARVSDYVAQWMLRPVQPYSCHEVVSRRITEEKAGTQSRKKPVPGCSVFVSHTIHPSIHPNPPINASAISNSSVCQSTAAGR